MAIRHYDWRPDTCGCHIQEWHDTDKDTWGTEKVYHLCEQHAGVAHEEIRDVICGHPDSEQQRIASVRRALSENHPELMITRYNSDGDEETVLHPDVVLKHEFTGKGHHRVLVSTLKGMARKHLTDEHRSALQKTLETVHPPGLILIR